MKRHQGLPPAGWEYVPNMAGYIREKKAPAPKDGERGPKGEKGDKGDQGDKGDKGPAGKNGVNGARGPRGERGPEGPAGRDGRDGQRGPAGANGKDGADGRDGKDGVDGVGIADIKTHGADMLIKMSDGQEKRFKIAGGRSSTPFGGSAPAPAPTPATPQQVYVQDTQPSFGTGVVGLWIQTGLGNDGSGFTMWFEDGVTT